MCPTIRRIGNDSMLALHSATISLLFRFSILRYLGEVSADCKNSGFAQLLYSARNWGSFKVGVWGGVFEGDLASLNF